MRGLFSVCSGDTKKYYLINTATSNASKNAALFSCKPQGQLRQHKLNTHDFSEVVHALHLQISLLHSFKSQHESIIRSKEFSSKTYLELSNIQCMKPHLVLTRFHLPQNQVDERVSNIDVKLASINAELSTYQSKLSKMRDGPGKTAIKQKALKVLQRRKLYESQRDQLQQQSWNMEQAGMMQDNLKNVMTTVDAMKTTNKALKQQYGKINIDKIERMQDEMADLMDIGNDIQESISRSYDVPEDVDEAELDAELEALGDEADFEGLGAESTPSFMVDEVPNFIDEPPAKTDQLKEAAG
ncbi:hypothetical protein B7494_g5371 [Chlorociboria aeruginascens]|nr:hypothetical protein B7494_g5371 [Chlorociboria aeruginascens]